MGASVCSLHLVCAIPLVFTDKSEVLLYLSIDTLSAGLGQKGHECQIDTGRSASASVIQTSAFPQGGAGNSRRSDVSKQECVLAEMLLC